MNTSLEGHPRLVALGGASSYEKPHSIEAFRLGLRLGATGIHSRVWTTSDGQAVLDSDGVTGSRLRRRSIRDVASGDLPSGLVPLHVLLDELPAGTDVMLELSSISDYSAAVADLGNWSGLDKSGVWIISNDLGLLENLAGSSSSIRLAHSTRIPSLDRGLEAHAALLRRVGVHGLVVNFDELTAGHVVMLHRFTRHAIAVGPQHERQMQEVLGMGIDALVSAQVERMVDVANNLGIKAR